MMMMGWSACSACSKVTGATTSSTKLRQGYFGGMSVGFQPLVVTRGADGVREIREAKLVEVSVVGMPAYEGAGIVAVREAQNFDDLLAPFRNPPAVNLDPIRPLW